jgi:hypothetical protein
VPWDFKAIHEIAWTMCPGWQAYTDVEMNYLRCAVAPALIHDLLKENAVGQPQIVRVNGIATSGNTVTHAYHIARYCELTHTDLSDVHYLIEFGGGFGSMARLFRRVLPEDATITIIDLPEMIVMQWVYLTCIFGLDQIHVMKTPADSPAVGKINLCPVDVRSVLDNNKPDMFVSTWGMNESDQGSIDWLMKSDLFGARHVLVAYAGADASSAFPMSSEINKIQRPNLVKEQIAHLPSQYYLFA